MAEAQEESPELLALRREILPMFLLLYNDKETITQEQCLYIFRALKINYQFLPSDNPFLTIDDVVEKVYQRDVENLKYKCEVITKALAPFEYYYKGYVEMAKLKAYMHNVMSAGELEKVLELYNMSTADEVDLEDIVSRLVKQ